jgi:hypothetical protein
MGIEKGFLKQKNGGGGTLLGIDITRQGDNETIIYDVWPVVWKAMSKKRTEEEGRTGEVGLQSRNAALAFLLHIWFYSHLAALNNPLSFETEEGAAAAADGRQKRKNAPGIQPDQGVGYVRREGCDQVESGRPFLECIQLPPPARPGAAC